MIRLFNAYFPTRTLLLTVTEALLVTVAFVVAVFFWAGTAMDANIYLLYENGFGRIALLVGIFVTLMYYFDLYDSIVLSNRREVVTRLVGVLGCAFVALSVLYYAFPEISLVGTTLWLGVGIVAVTVPAWRKLFFVLNRSARFSERAVLYGDGPLAMPLMQEIASRSELGVRVVGFVGQTTETAAGVPRFDDSDLEELVGERGVRRVVITMGDRRGKLRVEELLRLKTRGIYIQDGPEYYESITGKIPLDSLRLSWLLFSPGFHVRAALRLYKRVFSLILGSLAIVITSPIMLLAAIAIRLDSKGPAIFRQTRVGEHGKLFTVYKFRSMYEGSDKVKLSPAEHGDARVTRVGKWLRRTRIDELPQLFNIVKGDMAFVGPRPFVPDQEEECAQQIPFYRERWLVKPGATGWAQINRGYNATLEDNKEKLAYDLFYIKNVSFGLDLFIMFSTIKILLLGRGGR
ncbi:MAG TPA: sugar transferase [Terriglobales bacterium]|jgi:sugar transferase (PEP-CTERM system associated)|nr:sugar transferase [Terriglobales bacterium]